MHALLDNFGCVKHFLNALFDIFRVCETFCARFVGHFWGVKHFVHALLDNFGCETFCARVVGQFYLLECVTYPKRDIEVSNARRRKTILTKKLHKIISIWFLILKIWKILELMQFAELKNVENWRRYPSMILSNIRVHKMFHSLIILFYVMCWPKQNGGLGRGGPRGPPKNKKCSE